MGLKTEKNSYVCASCGQAKDSITKPFHLRNNGKVCPSCIRKMEYNEPAKFVYQNEMLDITAPSKGIDIDISPDGMVLWLTVDGKCALRVSKIPELFLGDKLIERAVGIYNKRRYVLDPIEEKTDGK